MGKIIPFPSRFVCFREVRNLVDLVGWEAGGGEVLSDSITFEHEISPATGAVRTKAVLTEGGRAYLEMVTATVTCPQLMYQFQS